MHHILAVLIASQNRNNDDNNAFHDSNLLVCTGCPKQTTPMLLELVETWGAFCLGHMVLTNTIRK